MHELADSLKSFDRVVIKKKVRARWNFSNLDIAQPKPWQIRQIFVRVTVKKETWNR